MARPTFTAQMVCQGQVEESVKALFGLTSDPGKTTTYVDSLFTCTYTVPQGKLVLKVKEAGSDAAAKAYFDGLQAGATGAVPLEGLESLGLPAFKTSSGTAAFVRDDKTLLVDATGLPAQVGPQKTSRTSFAYTVASDVLYCWKEHAPNG